MNETKKVWGWDGNGIPSREINEVMVDFEDFIERARHLKAGEGPLIFYLPNAGRAYPYRKGLAIVSIAFGKPITLHFYRPGFTLFFQKSVLWSPMRLRGYVYDELMGRGRGIFGWMFDSRRAKIDAWWKEEWTA